MPSGLLSRRQFLATMFTPVIHLPPIAPAVKPPLPGIKKPEFWFGEKVEFTWTDENSGQFHTERGEIVGANWNQPDNQWEYAVTWLSSTAYPTDNYPIADSNFVTADILSRVKAYAN
ncbi:hypothetical protein [Microcoleus sp. D2_18a_B4]|uniref:hypothetical protein n=1 Tax=Microcoleus sp. D2_18a_B4 TaxID=3055329 RepID=UPI002FD00662